MTNPKQLVDIDVTVNGMRVNDTVPARMTVADYLRDKLELTGTHLGCEHGVCGACTIIVDGQSVRSCIMFSAQLDGTTLLTVEGLENSPGELHPIQAAFRACHALQCGFCTPGLLLTVYEFLLTHREPSEEEIRHALSGNLCRCTGYSGIVQAVQMADRTWER